MSAPKGYDTTIARIAGNIAGHMLDRVVVTGQLHTVTFSLENLRLVATTAVSLAREIILEVKRTEPQP